MIKTNSSKIAILITGVPATGKTTLSKNFCKNHGWAYISLNDLVESKKLYSKTDKKDGAKIVKLKPLEKEANLQISKSKSNIIIDGHLGCEIKLNVQKIIVLRLNPKILFTRLNSRKYSKEKMAQNVEAEILNYCTIMCEENYSKGKITEIDASSISRQKLLAYLKKITAQKNKKLAAGKKINWMSYLLK